MVFNNPKATSPNCSDSLQVLLRCATLLPGAVEEICRWIVSFPVATRNFLRGNDQLMELEGGDHLGKLEVKLGEVRISRGPRISMMVHDDYSG